MKYIVTLCRILVGVLFIISGFIKGTNDTLGFSYKLDEYFLVFNMSFMSAFSVALAQFICVAEIVLGVATLVGWRMNLVTWLLMLMIVFFTFLTFLFCLFQCC
ncbi:MAG: DoxX family membrane protein [Bacteroidota bacterium]|nr:MAG: DoxX family membrane protein [Bacteroidota bacterium]